MSKFKACRIIANVMTNKGFMNGWFGDVSDEYKLDQANGLMRLKRGKPDAVWTADWWVEMNRFNMTHYCRIPERVIKAALLS